MLRTLAQDLSPVRGHVALLALAAERAVVPVVGLMATDTRHRQRRFVLHRDPMTGVARGPRMRAVEGELGPRAVVEVPDAPVADVVALLALRAQSALVGIVLVVTTAAFERLHVPEAQRRVAALAFRQGVTAEQRELRLGVIERGALPVGGAVALLARLALLALVLVFLLVALDARVRRARGSSGPCGSSRTAYPRACRSAESACAGGRTSISSSCARRGSLRTSRQGRPCGCHPCDGSRCR